MFGELLSRYATYNPGIALIHEDRRISWKELNERVNRLSNALLNLGIKKGEKVAILFSNRPEFIESNFALQKIGAVPVPLNFRYIDSEVEYVVKNSDSIGIIFQHDFLPSVKPERLGVKHYICTEKVDGFLDYEELIRSNSAREPKVKVSERDTALICYTGGTTGFPKGVVLTYSHFIKNISFFLRMVLHLPPRLGGREGEMERRLNLAFEALLDGVIEPIISDPELSSKVTILRFNFGSVTILVKDGRLKVYRGEPEKYDLLVEWREDILPLMSKVVQWLSCPGIKGPLNLAVLGMRRKFRIKKSFRSGVRFLSAARRALKGKGPQTKMICAPPLFHLAAYSSGIVTWILSGTQTLILPEKFDAERILELVERERADFLVMVPTMWKRVVEVKKEYDLSSLSMAISGAAVLEKELKKEILKKFPNALIVDVFGQTEMSPATTVRFDGEEEGILDRCVGKPLPGVDVRIVDENGKDVQPGKIGEIIYRSETIMKEYYKDPERTEATIKDGWFYSGDLGRFDESGNLYIIERKQECITSGAEKIFPYEVEEIIRKNPKVEDVCVIGVPDPEWGESVRAIVKLKEGEKAEEEEIIEWCRGKMAGYKKPKSVVFVSSFPVSPAEKIQRGKIKEMYGKCRL